MYACIQIQIIIACLLIRYCYDTCARTSSAQLGFGLSDGHFPLSTFYLFSLSLSLPFDTMVALFAKLILQRQDVRLRALGHDPVRVDL